MKYLNFLELFKYLPPLDKFSCANKVRTNRKKIKKKKKNKKALIDATLRINY